MKVGQLLAKIMAGEASPKSATAGAAPAESTAVDKEAEKDSGMPLASSACAQGRRICLLCLSRMGHVLSLDQEGLKTCMYSNSDVDTLPLWIAHLLHQAPVKSAVVPCILQCHQGKCFPLGTHRPAAACQA